MLLELTVPRDDRLEEAFERKLSRYTGLVNDCQQDGWRARYFPRECGGVWGTEASRVPNDLTESA